MNIADISSKSVILKALANAKRLEILCYLKKEELCVSALEDLVGLTQSALSQHLAVLRKANIVKTRRHAQTIYYRMDNPLVKDLMKLLKL